MHLLQALYDMRLGIKEKRKKGKALPHKLYFCLIKELFKLISPPFLLHKRKLSKSKNLICLVGFCSEKLHKISSGLQQDRAVKSIPLGNQ